MERIISRREFASRLGVSEPTLDRRESEAMRGDDDNFPRRRQLGAGERVGRIGYLESEVDQFLRELPMARLTTRTETARKSARAKANREDP